MNEKNLDFLKKQVFFSGFGEGLEKELAEKIEKQSPTFDLTHKTAFGKDEATATLSFRKSESSDMYFFNKYNLAVKPEGDKEALNQTFFIGKENNITLKEAYNLMSGRAIHKEFVKMERVGEGDAARYKATDEKYNAWMKLDFKEADKDGNFKQLKFNDKYGFDLDKALAKLPIKELENESAKERLVDSLNKGNLQSVTFVKDNQETKHFIEANPKDRTINVYDSSMQRVSQKQEEKQSQGEQQKTGQDVKKEGKKQDVAEEAGGQKEAKQKRRGQSVA